MTEERVQRRLAAILAADVVGYSRMVAADEAGALAALRAARAELLDPSIDGHGGRIVKTMGDGVLVEFPSAVDALRCAMAIQTGMAARAGELRLRIGVNVGDVVIEDGDILGDGVNIASRLEGVAEPGGVAISGGVREHIVGRIDVEFRDGGRRELKNIDRPIGIWHWSPVGVSPAPAAALALPDKPSIAVLPFDNMSGDPDQEYFADGLTEDIITTLSKIAGLFVIARNSSFAYKHQERDVRQIAAELGVRYILEGSVRTVAKRMRISIQLIDAKDGGHVWAERYDRIVDDVFAIQDEITLSVATELQVQLSEGEQARIRYTTTSNVEAWESWVRGVAYYRRDVSKDGVGRARDFWERALALDPQSAALNAMLGLIYWASARYGWWNDRETELAQAEGYIEAAMAMDGTNADAHCVHALILLMRGRHDEAIAEARRAIDLGPGSADIAAFTSLVFNFSGHADEALLQIKKAMRLSPIYPAWYLGDLGFANRLVGRHEKAISAFREYGERSPGFGHIDLVIIYGELDRMEEARGEAVRLLAARPGFTITSWRQSQFYKNPARLEADVAALRKVGLPV